MNLKTTLVLLILVVAGAVLFLYGPALAPFLQVATTTTASPEVSENNTLAVLRKQLTTQKLEVIEIGDGPAKVVLERGAGGVWNLPGKWPTRAEELSQLVHLLTDLRSRFAPIPLKDEAQLADYGLDKPTVTVQVRADGKDYRLALGEERGAGFSRPTYLRLYDKDGDQWQPRSEVVRLAPGIAAAVNRPLDYYQQRRLFPSERVAKGGDSPEKVETLNARSVSAASKDSTFELKKEGGQWEFAQPYRDRLDPDRLQSLLTAIPDVWAERFITGPKKDLDEYGLKEPLHTLAVTTPAGDTVTLLIGKKSRDDERTVVKPAPPGAPFPPTTEKIKEPIHFAKLKDNDQVFEIKFDKLGKDVFIALPSLRDARLARFQPENVKQLEIKQGDTTIVLAKDKDRWRLKKPLDADAEKGKVDELLRKLSGLEARGPDLHDKADLKDVGLETPAATLTVTVEDEKDKKERTVTYNLGKRDMDLGKVYVQVAGWPRVSTVDLDLTKLADRPALAYRGRGIFDFVESDLDQIDVQNPKEKYALKRVKGDWQLAAPVEAPADSRKALDLANDLSRLTAVEYVNDAPTPEQLEKDYGLAKPELSVTLAFAGKDKPPQSLQIGKQRPGKPEYFARLEGDKTPAVFVIDKKVHDELERTALAYRPLQLWQVPPPDIASIKIEKQGETAYRLERDGDKQWKVTGPFDAVVADRQAAPLIAALATLKIERYETHASKELEKFGLDKPFLTLALQEKAKDAGSQAPPAKTILIGKETGSDGDRFAKLADSDAVVVVGPKFVKDFDGSPLELLSRQLLAVNARQITRIKSTQGDVPMTLEPKGDDWLVEAGPAKFTADPAAVGSLIFVVANLHADRFAAYGSKLDLAKFGLDKPAFTLTLTSQADKDAKPVEHTIAVGKPVEGSQGDRYIRVDDQPGVAVVRSFVATDLGRTYLDFVDRTLLKLEPAAVSAITRKMGSQELELIKKDDAWQLVKPAEQKADAQAVETLVKQLARLRAEGIAAYPIKDPKQFGLAEPTAVITLKVNEGEGKTAEKVLKIGSEVNPDAKGAKAQDRYALVDGVDAIGILPGPLVDRLLASPIKFRDRALARFASADKAILERGPRKAVFTNVDGTWKLTEPLEAEAEQNDLDEFVNALARLRADDLVDDKPADLKDYGLDKPECRWRFVAGDKDVLSLVIGGKEKTKDGPGQRVYAKLADQDLVFLLSPQLTARVLAEYRERKLWPPLDALQIERLEYRYDNKPFVLEKVDNAWQLEGKPDAKVNQSAVEDALAALAGLKAERTVVDKDANPKLFGLDPAQLELTVATRGGGKRVLKIGRSEGDSKRSYAQVSDGKRSDVFIISEADGAKLLRDLAAFTKPAKEKDKE